jgi:hypothetical protein
MRRVKSLWDEIEEIAARGGTPVVTLPRALEIVESRRPVGRPRVHPVGAKRGHGYALTMPSGRPMRCRRRGCNKTLRKDAESICCSPECEFMLRDQCESFLEVLDGKVAARHLAPWHRTFRRRLQRDEVATTRRAKGRPTTR